MMFKNIQKVELRYSVTISSSKRFYRFPEITTPIIVFVGRSNVGKSSVINSLIGRKIAFVSKDPGKTKQINYYDINSKLYLVDLPGYGYAKVGKKLMIAWEELIEKFFNHNQNIQLIILVLDIRRDFQDLDKLMLEYLVKFNISFIVILNKADKFSNQQIIQKRSYYKEVLGIENRYILPYSAKTEIGRKELISLIGEFLTREKSAQNILK